MKTQIELSNATPEKLQDAWHNAMMLINRPESTFDGYRHYAAGILGQFAAYEEMAKLVDAMAADNETYQLLENDLWQPATFADMVSNAIAVIEAINIAAERLGVDARTGNLLQPA